MATTPTSTPVSFSFAQDTKADGALFNVDQPSDNGPAMSGTVELEGSVKVPLSGFVKTSGAGTRYMSLSFGSENGVHYYGKLFRQENKRYASGPDYTGFVTLLACEHADQYSAGEWDDAPQLQVCGWRKRNADGSARIALQISSPRVRSEEVAF